MAATASVQSSSAFAFQQVRKFAGLFRSGSKTVSKELESLSDWWDWTDVVSSLTAVLVQTIHVPWMPIRL